MGNIEQVKKILENKNITIEEQTVTDREDRWDAHNGQMLPNDAKELATKIAALYSEPQVCPHCKGSGRFYADSKVHYAYANLPTVQCAYCDGTGKVSACIPEIAKTARVSDNTIARVKVIEARATPEQKEQLVNGSKTINQIFVSVRRDEVKETISKKTDWPEGKYRVIYADPPWAYGNSMPDYSTDQSDHYTLMSISEICKLPIVDLAEDNAVLFLWVTSPILEESFEVIKAWGFKYKASFVWDKIKHNMGHYNSVRHEFLLIAVRGSCPPDENKLFDSVLSVERTEHSAKPEVFRGIIDTLYPYGPRIELFARSRHDNWEVFGNDIS